MELIDNISHLLGDSLKKSIKAGSRLKIAASCFSIYAYEALKEELEKIDSLEFIFTAPTFVPSEVTDKVRKERREFHIPKAEREKGFYGTEFEIQLKNKLTQRAIAKECADWMKRKVTFKSNTSRSPMQQFACVSSNEQQSVYLPLHGFTAVDLGYERGDAVSNFVNKLDDLDMTRNYLALFDQIWRNPEKLEDVTAHIHEHIASVYQENSPERIYFLMLQNIFSEFLEELDPDVLPNDLTGYEDSLIWKKLFNFQRDAATGIINKLESFNGCILADSVGLGKTFTALAVIKYYELRNRSVLVLCPKKLADNWLTYNRNLVTNVFARDRFNYDVLCHTDLQRTRGDSFGTPLNRINWGNYDLVVIDESHNFRNNDAFKERQTRYQKLMNRVIREGVKTKVLMLSATPVNNRFTDLKNQLALAYEGNPEQLSSKLQHASDIDGIFRKAQAAFNAWSQLPIERRTASQLLNTLDFDFFELLDSVTIARSRRHVQSFYDTSDIGKFPTRRKPISFHCPLTHDPGVPGFNAIYEQLTLIKLCVHTPIAYILPSRLVKYEELYDTEVERGAGKFRQADREKSLQALMTVNLLKRLESSVHAFRMTLAKLERACQDTLSKIEEFKLAGKDERFPDLTGELDELEPDEDDILGDGLNIGGKIQISLSDMDLPSWQHDLEGDLIIIRGLLSEANKVTPERDAKLQHLKHQIAAKIEAPFNPRNRKVLLFTAFADTADYLYEHLAHPLLESHQIHTAKVTGMDRPKSTLSRTYDFQSLLTLFSPRSKDKAAILPNDPSEVDLLIGTDCISEGQNLQDCDLVINYDIHWNPVRIIQRFGRVDRIGSPNDSIQLVNYWPDITLDEYINLKERVENRMVIADVTATGDDNPLNQESNDIAYRKEQLRRLQEEVIELEDVKTGVSITDLGLNDFRMDLINYIKANPEMTGLPNGMHTVVAADPAKGLVPGVIFALRNVHQTVNINQQNRLHPFYLLYLSQDGSVITNHTEAKRLLDMARLACKGKGSPAWDICRAFNEETCDGRDMRRYSTLLDAAIRSVIDIKDMRDVDSLFKGERTTALTDRIHGLEDFELIAFIVIKEAS
jgi:superfamily II DNA or RNA helicase